MSAKLQVTKSQVNNFFHPIVDDLCVGHIFDTHEVTGNDNRILWTLINAMRINSGHSVTMSRQMILDKNKAIKNVNTISRITSRWEKWGILEIKRGGYDRENRSWLPNTYSINWESFFTHFGEFIDCLKGKFKALITQVKSQFLGLSRDAQSITDSDASSITLKTSEEEKKSTYKVAIAPLYIPKEKKEFNLLPKEEDPPMSDPETSPISILIPHEPTKKHSFDVTMRECPETYRAIALKEGIHSDWVDEEYEEFMRYWIGVAKTARGKKSDWPATWRNWVRSQVHDFRRKYKKIARPVDPDAPKNQTIDIPSIDVTHYDASVVSVVKDLCRKIGPAEFKSWFHAATFKKTEDGYDVIYQKKDSFAYQRVRQRFSEECEHLNIDVINLNH